MRRMPLEGIRVADFCWVGAGSYTTKILADLGAEVIKVESATRVDSVRRLPPFKDKVPGVNRSGYFADRNSNKQSVTLNLKHKEAQRLAKLLILKSDIIANNFTPGTMEKFGLGYDAVREWKPEIVYLAMSLMGAAGPEANFRGYGLSVNALSGLLHLTGWPDRPPAGTGTNFPDHIPNPCHAAFAVLAALRHKRVTGQGQYIDMSQLEPSLALLGPTLLDYTTNCRVQGRTGNQHDGKAPHGVYPCKGDDRWIAISVANDLQWLALKQVFQGADWTEMPCYSTTSGRLLNRSKLDDLLSRTTKDWGADQLMHELQKHGVHAGIVQNASDIFSDPQLKHRGHWIRLYHSEMGVVSHNALPFQIDGKTIGPIRPAPLLGEHTDKVCEQLLGLTTADIATLRYDGALT